MLAANATLLRYWLTEDYKSIRIAWVDAQGIERSASGYTAEGQSALGWHYGKPPEALRIAARDCLADGYEHSIPGCLFVGFESYREQDRQVAARCSSCGVVQADEDDLSERGECTRCFVSRLAVAS